MQRVILFFISSAILMLMPELLKGIQVVLGIAEPGTVGAILNIQKLMAGMIGFISSIYYVGGIIFAIRGFIALKECSETGGRTYSHEQEEVELPKVKIKKTVSAIDDKKIELLVEKIKNKSKYLLDNPQIDNEIESKHIAEKSVSAYLPKLIDAYTAISPELRKKKVNNSLSANDMTCQQLEIIHAGLCEIELGLLNKSHDTLKVSSKFLNQIFKKNDKVIELEI